MRRSKLRNLTICLCMICVVAFSVATPIVRVSALAQEITPELEPVYDTEVVSLQDYVDNVLTDAQVAVFNTILGSYVASQAGLNEYDLEYPYNERTGVIGWLQDAGMKLYNAIITGGSFDLVTGTDLRTYIITAASYAIGMAQKAHSYSDMNDFLNDVDNSTHYFVPIDPILQASINSYFGRDYGLWNWQFEDKPFYTNFTWKTCNIGAYQTAYNNKVSALSSHRVHLNLNDTYGSQFTGGVNTSNVVLYLDTSSGTYKVCSLDAGHTDSLSISLVYCRIDSSNNATGVSDTTYTGIRINGSINLSNYGTLLEAVRAIYLNPKSISGTSLVIPLSELSPRCFVGTSWANAQEIFNFDGLNFDQNNSPSYYQVPDDSYIDLKGFLTDIVNNTNILNVILDNLFKPDGTLNVDPALIKVSITIPDTNPLPVNLNDVSEIIDNTYLDLVKERASQASETIGEYVAFWHNCDPEVVYVSLGAILIIAIGAFIGKWGHS